MLPGPMSATPGSRALGAARQSAGGLEMLRLVRAPSRSRGVAPTRPHRLACAPRVRAGADVGLGTGLQSLGRAEKSLRLVGGNICEVLEVSTCEFPHTTVVVVPGNPGICEYYGEFLEFLAADLPEGCNVVRCCGSCSRPFELLPCAPS